MEEQQRHTSLDQNTSTTSTLALPCLGVCLAHVTVSKQLRLCGEFSAESGRCLHVGANISLIYKESYFFKMNEALEWSQVPGGHFPQEQIQGPLSGKRFWYFLKNTESLCNCKAHRYYCMNVTFLYKRQIGVLQCLNSKNIDDITVKQQLTLQNIPYVYRTPLNLNHFNLFFGSMLPEKRAMLER